VLRRRKNNNAAPGKGISLTGTPSIAVRVTGGYPQNARHNDGLTNWITPPGTISIDIAVDRVGLSIKKSA
jgi:hypothetical protein